MESDSWLGLGGLLLCLVLLVFMSAAEAGLNSISRGRIGHLREKSASKAEAVARLLQQPHSLRSTIIIVKSLTIVVFASLTTALGVRYYAPNWAIVSLGTAACLIILLFFQLSVKAIAEQNQERTALFVAKTMAVFTIVLTPFARLFRLGGDLALLVFKEGNPSPQEETGDLAVLADIGESENTIEEDEREMIRGIIGLEETTAHEIMVPRIDIVAVDKETPIPKVIDVIIEHGYSRIPVYEETIDNIIGIIYAKDLLEGLRNGHYPATLEEIARPAHFIPESKKIDELLHEFQQKRVHIAIVVDEYGGTAGLVTIEDLLEEIVGEIEDEYDTGEPPIRRISETEAIMDARVSIHDLNEMFGLSIQGEDFDTIGGFLFARLGRIPNVGDEIEADGVVLSILSTVGRRIKKVKAVKSEKTEQTEQ